METPENENDLDLNLTEAEIERMILIHSLGITEEDVQADPDPVPWIDAEGEDFVREVIRYMRDIKNIEFTCRHLYGFELTYYQVMILQQLWNHKLCLMCAARGFSKSTLLAVYAIHYAVMNQGHKVVITSAGFRQAKLIMESIHKIIENATVLQSMFGSEILYKRGTDRCYYQIGQSLITALPMGDGGTIRGERSQLTIVDEFATIDADIYEVVIKGFAVVSSDPIKQIRNHSKIEVLKQFGLWSKEQEELERQSNRGNQTIIAGTSSWQFNHFYKYYKNYKDIIEGAKSVSEDKNAPSTDPRDYCVIRIPYRVAPGGYYEQHIIDDARESNTELNFNMEYECIFPADSAGFYPRSLIESCVGRPSNPVVAYDTHEEIFFKPQTKGDPRQTYMFGIDPAHSSDSLAIVVLECHPTYRKIIYCWTINKTEFRKRERSVGESLNDYYGFCARKIRELMKIFPPSLIAMDAQGGGMALMEALGDSSKLLPGEEPILPIEVGHPLHSGRVYPDEDKLGLHLVELVQANVSYNNGANNGLRKDLEDKAILFPYWDQDGVNLDVAKYNPNFDALVPSRHDTYEDLNINIERIKDEISTIVITQTSTGADHWDTPTTKGQGHKKGRLRKDRYSAVLMANYAARRLARKEETPRTPCLGGAALQENVQEATSIKRTQFKTHQPAWFRKGREGVKKHRGFIP